MAILDMNGRYPRVSLNNEKNRRGISVHKIAVVRKLRVYTERELFGLELCVLRVLVPVKIFHFYTCTMKLNDIGTQ